MKDIINIEDAKQDIFELQIKFRELANEWECDATEYEYPTIALKELALVTRKADKYKGFIFEYKESEYTNTQYDEWYEYQSFSEEDFVNLNVNEKNYGKADAVAFDMKEELVLYIRRQIIAQMPKIELIGILCEIERYQTIYELFDEQKALNECDLDFFVQTNIKETKDMIIKELEMI